MLGADESEVWSPEEVGQTVTLTSATPVASGESRPLTLLLAVDGSASTSSIAVSVWLGTRGGDAAGGDLGSAHPGTSAAAGSVRPAVGIYARSLRTAFGRSNAVARLLPTAELFCNLE